MELYKQSDSILTAIHANQAWGFSNSDIKIAGLSASGTINHDPAAKKATLTASLPAQSDDKLLVAGDSILRANSSIYSSYHIALTAPYTIPANYIFDMSAEISWGRLP